jgi:hypothetical protein
LHYKVNGDWRVILGSANRLVGYLAGFSGASLFYVVWFSVEIRTPASNVGILFDVGFAIFFWLFEGMAAALVLMALPWYLALMLHHRIKRSGLIYFSVVAAALTTVLACATSSLAPKPFFVEDQTFLEGFMIAIQRQGICFLLSGLLFGATFWFVSERRRSSQP